MAQYMYRQENGLSMRFPLAPVLADIFMDNLEQNILQTTEAKRQINFWFRPVDDIITE